MIELPHGSVHISGARTPQEYPGSEDEQSTEHPYTSCRSPSSHISGIVVIVSPHFG